MCVRVFGGRGGGVGRGTKTNQQRIKVSNLHLLKEI